MSSRENGVSDDRLRVVIADCGDPSWQVKRSAVRELAGFIEHPAAFARLVAALSDEDLGVVDIATETLATVGGGTGLAEVAKAYALTEDNGTYTMSDRLLNLILDEKVSIIAGLKDIIATEPDGPAHDGAVDLITRLPPDQAC